MADPNVPLPDGLDDAVGATIASQQTQTAQQIRNNAMISSGTNPDQEAGFTHLAKFMNVPVDAVRANPDAIKAQAAAQTIDANNIAINSPATANVLTHPDNSKLAMDDIENMRNLETSVGAPSQPSLLEDTKTGGFQTYLKILGAFDKGAVGLNDLFPDGMPGKMSPEDREFYQNRSQQFDAAAQLIPPERWSGQVAAGLAYAPFMAAAPLVAGGSEGVARTNQLEAQGVDSDTATQAGLAEGSLQGLIQMLPLGKFSTAGAKPFVKSVIGSTAKAGLAGASQSVASDTAAGQILAANGYGDLAEQYAPSFDKASDSALFMMGLHGGMQGAYLAGSSDAHALVGNFVRNRMDAANAVSNADTVQNINDLAASSKLKARDPQAFHDFIADANQNGPVQDLYIDPAALAQSGIDPAGLLAVPGMDEQLNVAASTGGDVKIPVADFATHLAGTDYGQSLIDHVRTDPAAMSRAEANEFLQSSSSTDLKGEVEKVLAAKQQDQPFKDSMQKVQDDVLGKLSEANRFTDDVNKPYATLLSNFYGVQAARLGITPEELYAQHPVEIKAPSGEAAADELNKGQKLVILNKDGTPWKPGDDYGQAGKFETPEFKNWFGKSKVVDETGAPKVMYHGTGSDIPHFSYDFTSKGNDALGSGFYFASSPDTASGYAAGPMHGERIGENNPNVVPVHLAIEHPMRAGQKGDVTPEQVQKFIDRAPNKEQGLENWAEDPTEAMNAAKHAYSIDGENLMRGLFKIANDFYGDDTEAFNHAVKDILGFDGVHQKTGAGGDIYAAFFPEQIKSIHNAGEFDPNNPDILHQAMTTGRRGSFNPKTSTINLFHAADLSTFLHESGHFFLETMNKLALQKDAPQEIKDDMQATFDWLGVKDIGEWNSHDLEWQRDKHEQFARGFEAYLFEGKSPSIEMAGVFNRFRSWLLNVYRSASVLDVKLSPEIKSVFDRMLATSEQIKNAESVAHFDPLFKSPEEGGMTPEEFKSYHDLGVQATQDAVSNLEERSLRDMQWMSNAKSRMLKQMQKDTATKRAAVKREVTEQVMNEPVNKARTFFKRGELNGEKMEGVPHRLDIDEVSKMEHVPIEHLESKYGKYGILGKDGLHPEEAAEMFGFDNATDMLESLIYAENPREKIAGLTEQRLLERYGDLSSPDAMSRAVDSALHNDARAKFIATEANALQKATGGKKILAAAARNYAEQIVGRMKVRNLKPSQFSVAEVRAARNAEAARVKGDLKTAATEKRNQLIQNYAAKAAHEAVDEIDKGVNYLNKFNRKSTREAIGNTNMAQIDALLDRFDLSKSTTLKELDRRQSLKEWYDGQVEKGYEPAIDDRLLDEANKMSYKDMSVEGFRGVIDAVKSIEHLGRLKQKLIDRKEARDLDALVKEATDTMSQLPQRDVAEVRNPGAGGKGLDKINAKYLQGTGLLKSLDSSLLKLEQLFTWLDNNNSHGVFNRVVFRRIADGQGTEHDLQIPITAKLRELAEKMPDETKSDFNNRYKLPELIDSETGEASNMLKSEIMAMALNTGNESNYSKMLEGENWKRSDVQAVLDRHMSKGDWDYVQGLWDTVNSLWPHIEAMEKRLSGVAPDKIEASPVETKHGTYSGGYYPIVYDPLRSPDVDARNERSGDKLFENNYTRATTPKGHTIERSENYARPLYLSLDVLPRHLTSVIHDIAYREAVIDADKFLSDARVRRGIESSLGREYYKQIRPWLQAIANDKTYDSRGLSFWDKLAHSARTSATIVGLGYRLSTMLVHGSTATLNSVGEIGPKWLASGAKSFFGTPDKMANARDFIFDRSTEMKNRMNETDRDIRDALREMQLHTGEGPLSKAANGIAAVKRFAFYGVAALDMASAMPTWMGAYNRALSENRSEDDAIYEADKAVRNAHGAGGQKDLAAVQRGSESQKLWTLFYSFANHFYNRQRDIGRTAMSIPESLRAGDYEKAKDDFSMVLARSFFYFVAGQLIHGALTSPPSKNGRESWLAWAAKEIGAGMFFGIPVARDIASAAVNDREYTGTPVIQTVTSLGKTAEDIAGTLKGTGPSKKWVQHAITNAGYVFGLPTGQAAASGQFMWDVMDGQQQPRDMADWYNGIVHGHTDAK